MPVPELTGGRARGFPCPRCGASVVWAPGAARLRCDYCGHELDVAAPDGAGAPIAERPLQERLRSSETVGWGSERRSFRCSRCGAVESIDPGLAAGRCAFCAAPAVVETPPDATLVRPQGVLPFRIPREQAVASFRGWLGSLWFRPGELKRRAELDGVRGVYVPFWTFDVATVSRWTAEAGRRRGSGRNARVDWQRASGVLEHRFDDLPVPASRGLDDETAARLEPFPTAEMVAYDPRFLSGFLAEEYGVALGEAHAVARRRMEATLRAACRSEVPGELCRNLDIATTWTDATCKSGLLPVWIAAYRYGGIGYRFCVNGATGRAAGTAPWSAAKIALAVLAALAVLGFLLMRG